MGSRPTRNPHNDYRKEHQLTERIRVLSAGLLKRSADSTEESYQIRGKSQISVAMNRMAVVAHRIANSTRSNFLRTEVPPFALFCEPHNQQYLKPEDQRSLNNLRDTVLGRKVIDREFNLRTGFLVRNGQPSIGSARLDVYRKRPVLVYQQPQKEVHTWAQNVHSSCRIAVQPHA